MATGDKNDILARLKAVLPPWFPYVTPILDGLLSGPANALSFAYSLLAFGRLQTRLATISGGFLDLLAYDFFGLAFQRNLNEADAAFNARVKAEVFRPRATRAGLIKALTDLTGVAPVVFEPMRPLDTGAYGAPFCGYSRAGGYGSALMPYQALVNAYRPSTAGIPGVAGYRSAYGGYGVGAIEYADMSYNVGQVTDAQIYARVASVQPVAAIAWTQISNTPSSPNVIVVSISNLILGINTDLGLASATTNQTFNMGAASSAKTTTIDLGIGA